MHHAQALILAEEALNALKPYCERALIAGSIRRMKPEVKDIELVAIPKQVPAGLFGDTLEVDPDFCAAVCRWPKVKGEPTGKYTQRGLPGG
jgi:DNA polymerase/3'-5' exonuclease PolX